MIDCGDKIEEKYHGYFHEKVKRFSNTRLIHLLSVIHCSKMNFEDAGKKPVTVGPWGGQDGSSWDDGFYSTVRQVVISYGPAIDSIQFEYDEKGSSVWSEKHGGRGGKHTEKVKLDYPDEFLTSIYGYYGKTNEWGPILVRSLTFISNRKSYGPYGVEHGTCFSFPITGAKIVGFHGKSGWFLDSIGVHIKQLHKQNPSKPLFQTHNYTANGTAQNVSGYSVIQGSVGQNYDIVLAVRQKDDFSSKPCPNKLSMQLNCDSREVNDTEKKEKVSREFNETGFVGNKEKVTRESEESWKKEKAPQEFNERGKRETVPAVKKVPLKVEGVVTCGPWGGTGGSTFDDGAYSGIKQINVSRNVGIVYIKVLYDRDGQPVWGSRNGGTGGFKTEKVVFDFPNESLTYITGTFGPLMYMGPNVIRSITFYTNKGRHGPYGEEQGTPFSSKLKEGKIIGFHGRNGLFLDAIGVHVIEGKVPKHLTYNPCQAIVPCEPAGAISEIEHSQWSNKLVLAKRGPVEEVACGVVKEPAPCGAGPWGGEGGRPWDDGVFSGIKQIYLTRSAEGICSIQIEYDRNGQCIWSVKHGGNGGATTHRLQLEYPNEVLTCISGYYGSVNRDERHKVIKALTFHTSRGKYGPFGEEIGTFFTSTTTEGKVVGFHGRSSLFLDAIGVHMQHWLGNQRTSKSSLFKMF